MDNEISIFYVLGSVIDMILVLILIIWYSLKNKITENKDKFIMSVGSIVFIILSWVGVFVLLIVVCIMVFIKNFSNKLKGNNG